MVIIVVLVHAFANRWRQNIDIVIRTSISRYTTRNNLVGMQVLSIVVLQFQPTINLKNPIKNSKARFVAVFKKKCLTRMNVSQKRRRSCNGNVTSVKLVQAGITPPSTKCLISTRCRVNRHAAADLSHRPPFSQNCVVRIFFLYLNMF